jgi:hypothetical protein
LMRRGLCFVSAYLISQLTHQHLGLKTLIAISHTDLLGRRDG